MKSEWPTEVASDSSRSPEARTCRRVPAAFDETPCRKDRRLAPRRKAPARDLDPGHVDSDGEASRAERASGSPRASRRLELRKELAAVHDPVADRPEAAGRPRAPVGRFRTRAGGRRPPGADVGRRRVDPNVPGPGRRIRLTSPETSSTPWRHFEQPANSIEELPECVRIFTARGVPCAATGPAVSRRELDRLGLTTASFFDLGADKRWVCPLNSAGKVPQCIGITRGTFSISHAYAAPLRPHRVEVADRQQRHVGRAKLGDTAPFSDMRIIAELRPPDVALLPIGDFSHDGAEGRGVRVRDAESPPRDPDALGHFSRADGHARRSARRDRKTRRVDRGDRARAGRPLARVAGAATPSL